MTFNLQKLLAPTLAIAGKTGEALLSCFKNPKMLEVKQKADLSPLSSADLIAHEILITDLSALTPDFSIISEEGAIPDYELRKKYEYYWLLDPLDGTRSFLQNSPEFVISIALIHKNKAVLGVIYSPVYKTFYYACENFYAFKKENNSESQKIFTRKLDWSQLTVITGYFHRSARFEMLAQELPNIRIKKMNSALKYGKIAEGAVDIYPRFGPTSEWDSAAGQCILEQAGGIVVDLSGERLQYNAQSSLINPAFVALGDPGAQEQVLKILRRMA